MRLPALGGTPGRPPRRAGRFSPPHVHLGAFTCLEVFVTRWPFYLPACTTRVECQPFLPPACLPATVRCSHRAPAVPEFYRPIPCLLGTDSAPNVPHAGVTCEHLPAGPGCVTIELLPFLPTPAAPALEFTVCGWVPSPRCHLPVWVPSAPACLPAPLPLLERYPHCLACLFRYAPACSAVP